MTITIMPASAQEALPAQPGRILLVQYAANRGGSTFSGLLIAKGLIEAGWQVDVAFGFPGPGLDLYQDVGCQVYVIEHKNWLRARTVHQSLLRIVTELVASQRFVKLIQDSNPSLIYINSLASLAGAVAARRLGIPCIWHVRELFQDVGGEMVVPPLGGVYLVRKALQRLSHRLIGISHAVAESVLGDELAKQAVILPNAVSRDYFDFSVPRVECRQRLGLPLSGQIVGVPGTLRPVKGHPFFFEAATQLTKSIPNCQFAIAGEGAASYRDQLVAQVRRAGLDSQTHFLGSVNDMRAFYAACDVIAVPSQSESFGRIVIEAFAIGTPVVASAVGGMLETIEHSHTGLLSEYGNAKLFAENILSLLQGSELARKVTAQARLKAESEYSESLHQTRIHQVVQSAALLQYRA